MTRTTIYYPQRRLGLIFQAAAVIFLTVVSLGGLWQASRAVMGPVFLFWLLPGLISVGIIPLLAYRFYALQRAQYILERDGIHLRWGLRWEEIPINVVQWMRLSSELEHPLPLPRMRWPGAVLGVRRLPGGGQVEYLAAQTAPLVVIATPQVIYAISPSDPQGFIQSYRRLNEMGSITPLQARSLHPSFLMARVWRALPARYLLLAGLGFNLILLAWVSAIAPGRGQVVLGFITGAEAVPAVRLLLLPILSGFFYLVDFFLGLFVFRRVTDASLSSPGSAASKAALLAYLLWGSAALSAALFLAAIFFILQPH